MTVSTTWRLMCFWWRTRVGEWGDDPFAKRSASIFLGGYPQKQSEIHESFASMDPHVPRLDKWKGFAGRVEYRFYIFDWFPSRGIADVICNWCFFLTNLAESSRMVFLNYCFLLISEWWIYHFTCKSYSYKLLKLKKWCVNLFRSKFPQAFLPGFSFTSTCGVTSGGWSPKSYVWTPVVHGWMGELENERLMVFCWELVTTNF